MIKPGDLVRLKRVLPGIPDRKKGIFRVIETTPLPGRWRMVKGKRVCVRKPGPLLVLDKPWHEHALPPPFSLVNNSIHSKHVVFVKRPVRPVAGKSCQKAQPARDLSGPGRSGDGSS